MARVQARADQAMVFFHRLHYDLGRIPAVQAFWSRRSVRMNGDADLELIHQAIETVEAVRVGIRAEIAHAEPAGKLEFAAIGCVILAEALDPERDGGNPVFPAQIAH